MEAISAGQIKCALNDDKRHAKIVGGSQNGLIKGNVLSVRVFHLKAKIYGAYNMDICRS